MTLRSLSGSLAAASLIGASTFAQTSSRVLQSPGSVPFQAKYTFEYNATEAWLAQGELAAGGRVVAFHKTPMWDLVLRVPPELSVDSAGDPELPFLSESRLNTENAAFALSVLPVNQLDFDHDGVLDPTVIFQWTGVMPDTDEGDGGGAPPAVKIEAIWMLNGVQDYLRAAVVVEITNPAEESRYKIWSCAFPGIGIGNLDDNGEDILATGKYGGLLYGNPINFVDPHDSQQRGFRFQVEPATSLVKNGMPDLTSVEPGVQTVPLWAYYNDVEKYGVYLSNNDDEGMFKAVNLRADPTASPGPLAPGPGALKFEVIQYPHSIESQVPGVPGVGIFDMIHYESPYWVFVGVFNGDWIDAAKKYRDFRINNTEGRFEWLHDDSRPSGRDTNRFLPPELKSSPYQVRIHGGFVTSPWDGNEPERGPRLLTGPYCVDVLDIPAARARLTFFEQQFAPSPGLGFPFLDFDRFTVTNDEVRYDPTTDSGYYAPRPDGTMAEVHALVQDSGARHLVVLDSMTEKFNQNELWDNACERQCGNPPGSGDFPGRWCCALDAAYRKLSFENCLVPIPRIDVPRFDCTTGLQAPGYRPYFTACPAGMATELVGPPPSLCGSNSAVISCGARWGAAFRDILVETSMGLNITGGLRTNAPSTSTAPCFSRHHDHLPGFGSSVLKGWYDLFDGVRGQMGDDFYFLSELGGSTFSRVHRVQNPIALYFSADLDNKGDLHGPTSEWNRYFDAPIRKIPLLQMVADELRFVDHNEYASLGLPWTMASASVPVPDIDGNGCDNTRRFFQYLPAAPCTGDEAVDFPAVSAALNCWAMTKRVFVHQASIPIDDLNLAGEAGEATFSLFDPNPTTRSEFAARGMLEFYRGLGLFLQTEDYMEYFGGTMERAPRIRLLDPTVPQQELPQTFVVPGSVLAASFKNLHDYFTLSYDGPSAPGGPHRPDADWRLDRYRPVDSMIFNTDSSTTNFALQIAPEEHESWLPHGMYRSWRDTSKLVMFVANPWGVKHKLDSGQTRPMNIFTFDFQSPDDSPTSNTYSFEFEIDPTDYGYPPTAEYSVQRTRFNKSGGALPGIFYGNGSGTRTITATIGAFQYEAFLIDFE